MHALSRSVCLPLLIGACLMASTDSVFAQQGLPVQNLPDGQAGGGGQANLVPVWGPDVFGGYATTHVLVRVKAGIEPITLPRAMSFAPAGMSIKQALARPEVQSVAAALQKRKVSAISKAFSNQPKNRQLAEFYGLDRYYRIDVPQGSDTQAIVNELRAFGQSFEVVELDGIGGIAGVPNDSSFGQQWGMNNTGQNGGTPDADIDAPEAWDIHQGSADVLVAVLDTGIQSDHPDLIGRVTLGPPTYICNGLSNPPCTSTDSYDIHGHGTHCAGTIGANANNAMGIASMNWNCQILGVRVVNPINGGGTEQTVADGIIYAADNGADIISMSLQFYAGTTALQNAVAYAYDSGSLPIAATGNFHPAGEIAYPAKFPKCMAVGATNKLDAKYSGSNTGPEIDVTAPGQDVYSLWLTNQTGGYSTTSGTSMATPHVSGLASLIRSYNPSFSVAEIEAIIKNTAEDKGNPGFDTQFGWGRINAHAALIAATPAPVCPGDITGDDTVDVNDLLLVINAWGSCPAPPALCPGDIAPDQRDGSVNVDDLLRVISQWGACP